MERRLIREYEQTLERLITKLTPDNHATAVSLASLPEKVRGFGHIKAGNVATMEREREALLREFDAPGRPSGYGCLRPRTPNAETQRTQRTQRNSRTRVTAEPS